MRSNGFSPPFAFQQVISWLIFIYIIASFVTSFVALLQVEESNGTSLKMVCGIVFPFYVLGIISTVITTVIVTGSDPTDPTVNQYRLHIKTLNAFKAG